MYGCFDENLEYLSVYVWFYWFGWRWFYVLIGWVNCFIVFNIKYEYMVFMWLGGISGSLEIGDWV